MNINLMKTFYISTIFLSLMTSFAWGLGLGGIKVKSAFTKKFVAVIPVSLQGDDGELNVEIGQATDYQLMQLARPEFIDWLLLTVEPDPAKPGGRLIVVTSPKPIYKPSFNLVIRASAGGGTVLENYFLAVDFRKSLVLDLPKPHEKEEHASIVKAETVLPEPEVAPPLKEEQPLPKPPPIAVAPVVTPKLPPIAVAPVVTPKLPPITVASVVTPKLTPVAVPEKVKTEPVVTAKAVEEKEPLVVVVKKQVETVEKPEFVEKPQKLLPKLKRIIPPSEEAEEVSPVNETALGGHEFLKLNPDVFKNRRVVQRGDTLYGIAKKLGASKKDRAAVVVAIYFENERAFINGNVNRLKSGAKLAYSRVNELAAGVTSFDARAFIERQFVQWKSRPRAPIRMENLVIERASFRDVLSFLENWKSHWMENNIKTLAGDYADDFRDRYGRGKTAFLKSRKSFNDRHPNIKLLFENISAARMGQAVAVSFTQSFNSDNYSSLGRKRLALKPSRGVLKITREDFSLKQGFSGKHAWVVHLASYRGKATIEANIKRLRSSGFTVFEAFALHPDGNKWYRLMAGRVSGREQAHLMASELKKAGEPYAAVLELPFALEVAVYDNHEESIELVKTLDENGFSPYLVETVETGGEVHYAVYVGAFATEEEAGIIRKTLSEQGMETRIAAP